MDDIARLANISKSTVSRALQGDPRVKSSTRERIVALARKHGYAVNSSARKLRQSRSNTIAVVIHLPPNADASWSGPFVIQLLADVANGLWVRHQDLLLCSPETGERQPYQTMIASKGVDGIIFLGQGIDDDWLQELVGTNAPFVVWGAVDGPPRYCTVGSDNYKGGQLVGARFKELGRRRVLFVGNRRHPEMGQRFAGLTHALGSRPGNRVDYAEVEGFSFEEAFQRSSSYLESLGEVFPDAVFAASDEIARAVIMALEDRGLSIPGDVSVIGYDDSPNAAHLRPKLTTVRQDTRQAGSMLVEKLFQMIDGGRPRSARLPTELIIRDT